MMKEVSKAEFYRAIYGDNLNVHPFSGRNSTTWHYMSGGYQTSRIFGRTDGGYAAPHGHVERYWISRAS